MTWRTEAFQVSDATVTHGQNSLKCAASFPAAFLKRCPPHVAAVVCTYTCNSFLISTPSKLYMPALIHFQIIELGASPRLRTHFQGSTSNDRGSPFTPKDAFATLSCVGSSNTACRPFCTSSVWMPREIEAFYLRSRASGAGCDSHCSHAARSSKWHRLTLSARLSILAVVFFSCCSRSASHLSAFASNKLGNWGLRRSKRSCNKRGSLSGLLREMGALIPGEKELICTARRLAGLGQKC